MRRPWSFKHAGGHVAASQALSVLVRGAAVDRAPQAASSGRTAQRRAHQSCESVPSVLFNALRVLGRRLRRAARVAACGALAVRNCLAVTDATLSEPLGAAEEGQQPPHHAEFPVPRRRRAPIVTAASQESERAVETAACTRIWPARTFHPAPRSIGHYLCGNGTSGPETRERAQHALSAPTSAGARMQP